MNTGYTAELPNAALNDVQRGKILMDKYETFGNKRRQLILQISLKMVQWKEEMFVELFLEH